MTQSADYDARSRNGRPMRTHERTCSDADHYDHTVLWDATCAECGCCWGCDNDCCAEAFCPNPECGCAPPASSTETPASIRPVSPPRSRVGSAPPGARDWSAFPCSDCPCRAAFLRLTCGNSRG